MSMARAPICLIVSLMYPVAVVLSVCSGVGGCGCPISSNVVSKIVASFALRKTDYISASAADDITCLRTVLMIKTAPLASIFGCRCYFPYKNLLLCFLPHVLKYTKHHCGCSISCLMHGIRVLLLDVWHNNLAT
jgi:hypothetical protein